MKIASYLELTQHIQKDGLSTQAYNRLRQELMAGRFQPGEWLKLRDVAAELGISLTPVRDALSRLVTEQGLEQSPAGAVRVPVITTARFHEIRDLRLNLEGLAAEEAARVATPVEIDQLEVVHQRLWTARMQNDVREMLLHNERFHLCLCEMARKPVLLKIVEGLWLQCGPLMPGFMRWLPVRRPQRHPHLTVIEALRARDPAGAGAGIREDINAYADALLRYLDERRSPSEKV